MSKVAEIIAAIPALLGDTAAAAGLAHDIGNALGSEVDDDDLRELRNALAMARPADPTVDAAVTVMAEVIDGLRSARRAPRNAEVILRDGLHRRILVALEHGPSTTGELAEKLDQGETVVSRALERLRELDLVEPPRREQVDRRRVQHHLTLFSRHALARLDAGARREPIWRLSWRPPPVEVTPPSSGRTLELAATHERGLRLLEEARSALTAACRSKGDARANLAVAALDYATQAAALISPVQDESAALDAFSICRACHLVRGTNPSIVMRDAEALVRDQATGTLDELKLQRIRRQSVRYADEERRKITPTKRSSLGRAEERDTFEGLGSVSTEGQ